MQKSENEWLKQAITGSTQEGSVFIDSTDALVTDGNYQYLIVNADCVFATLNTEDGRDLLAARSGDSGGLNLSGFTISKGMNILAPAGAIIKQIDLTSGSILAYG